MVVYILTIHFTAGPICPSFTPKLLVCTIASISCPTAEKGPIKVHKCFQLFFNQFCGLQLLTDNQRTLAIRITSSRNSPTVIPLSMRRWAIPQCSYWFYPDIARSKYNGEIFYRVMSALTYRQVSYCPFHQLWQHGRFSRSVSMFRLIKRLLFLSYN